jgi:hypothetical protein
MKILYKKYYLRRTLFVLEHKDKIIMVYRSSGLSGTGHKDKILPFMFINANFNSFREAPGYIYKEMLYDGEYISHHKKIDSFDGLEDKMNYLSEFLKDENEPDLYEPENIESMRAFIKNVSDELHQVCLDKKFYDLSEEF